jgi:hypothetical protein
VVADSVVSGFAGAGLDTGSDAGVGEDSSIVDSGPDAAGEAESLGGVAPSS